MAQFQKTPFGELVAFIEKSQEFPVLVDTVKKWIIDNHLQDELNILRVDMDTQKLKGAIRQYTYQNGVYGEPVRASNIYCAKSLNTCWSRFVICKEMMHIFDNPDEYAGTIAQISKLTFDLSSPVKSGSMSNQLVSDWIAIAKAILTLVPRKVRDDLLPIFTTGKKTAYDIALFLRIPEYYINYTFSTSYDTVWDMFCK